MRIHPRPFREETGLDFMLFRNRLGARKYRKTRSRDPEKREILLRLALARIRERERDDYIPVGPRCRRLR